MRKTTLSVLTLGMFLTGALAPQPVSARKPHKMHFVTGVFIGDSNTATDTKVGQGLGFVNWLNVILGYRYMFFNGGCYGATTRDWWLPSSVHAPFAFCYANSGDSPRLFDVRAAPFLPSVFAVIMLGSNDSVGALEDTPTPIAEYGQNLEGLTLKVVRTGTPLVILMTPPLRVDCIVQALRGQPAGIDCIARLEGYRDEVLRICQEHADEGVVCGPDVQEMTRTDFWTFFDPQEWNDFDQTHFTNEGHLRIAEGLLATLTANGL